MNESEFEAELRRIEPVKPSPRLAERIAVELEAEGHAVFSKAVAVSPDRSLQTTLPAAGILARGESTQARSRGWNIWSGLGWAFAGAAAAVALLLARGGFREKTAGPVELPSLTAPIAINEEPDESVAELIATEDEGLVYGADDSQPQRQLRLTYLERHIWTNPQSGAVIEFEVPREDVVWMPVAMQ